MMFRFACAAAALLWMVAAGGQASALEACHVGQRVKTPAGKPATVVAVEGSSCRVRVDGMSYTDVYAAFMLEALDDGGDGGDSDGDDRSGSSGGGPASGVYKCYYLSGGTLNYGFVDIHIRGGGAYGDGKGGNGRYHIAGNRLVFDSGPYIDHPAEMKNGNILITTPGGSFYMTCSPE